MRASSVLALGVLIGAGAALADHFLRRPAGARPPPAGPAEGRVSAPPAGWTGLPVRAWHAFNTHQILAVAAGVTFFGLLSLFPALGAFVSLFGLFANVEDARQGVARLSGLMPEGAVTVLTDQMTRLASADHRHLGLALLGGLMLSIWSANAGVKALIAGLNTAYDVQEKRRFIRLNALSLGFTAGATLFSILSIAAIGVAPATLDILGLSGLKGVSLLRWPILLAVVMAILSLLYRYGPCRERATWRWITPGGALASAAWIAMSLLFSWYAANFGHYDRTYGSLGAIVGFMTWIWLSILVVLLGAEINADIDRGRIADGGETPPGKGVAP